MCSTHDRDDEGKIIHLEQPAPKPAPVYKLEEWLAAGNGRKEWE